MKAAITSLSPSITKLIRADHTKILATFHRYHIDRSPAAKQALVNAVCLSLQIHAQAEEEVLYAALHGADPALLEKSVPEHEEMRRLIEALATWPLRTRPTTAYSWSSCGTIHHVADEETLLLPAADRLRAVRARALGAQFTKRKLQLTTRRLGEMVRNAVRATPTTTMVAAAGAVFAGAYLLRRLGSGSRGTNDLRLHGPQHRRHCSCRRRFLGPALLRAAFPPPAGGHT